MDGGDNCPATGSKLAQSRQQMHGGGTVQPRSGLICMKHVLSYSLKNVTKLVRGKEI